MNKIKSRYHDGEYKLYESTNKFYYINHKYSELTTMEEGFDNGTYNTHERMEYIIYILADLIHKFAQDYDDNENKKMKALEFANKNEQWIIEKILKHGFRNLTKKNKNDIITQKAKNG